MSLRRRDIALIVSISLNVFLIGAALTVYALHEASSPITGGPRSLMRAAASNLDEVHRAAFMELLHGQGKSIQAQTRSARAIRDEAWAALAAENFDPAAIKSRLALARELNVLAHRTIEDAVVDFAGGLTLDQRKSLSQAIRRTAAHQHIESAKERPNAR